MDKPKKIKVMRTKKGTPFLWESYNVYDEVVKSVAMLDGQGNFKNSIFSKRRSSRQSIVPLTEGDYILKFFKSTKEDVMSMSIFEITNISSTSNDVSADCTIRFENLPHVMDKKVKKVIKDNLSKSFPLPKVENFLESISKNYEKINEKVGNYTILNTLMPSILKNSNELESVQYEN